MKRLLAATVIFLSSCTAYADYSDTRYCEDTTRMLVSQRALITQGDKPEQWLVNYIKKDRSTAIREMFSDIELAAFVQTGTTSDQTEQFRRSMYLCLELMLDFKLHGEFSTKRKAKTFYEFKGW